MLNIPTIEALAKRRFDSRNDEMRLPDGSQQWQHRNLFKDAMEEAADGWNYCNLLLECIDTLAGCANVRSATAHFHEAYALLKIAWRQENSHNAPDCMPDEIPVERFGWPE